MFTIIDEVVLKKIGDFDKAWWVVVCETTSETIPNPASIVLTPSLHEQRDENLPGYWLIFDTNSLQYHFNTSWDDEEQAKTHATKCQESSDNNPAHHADHKQTFQWSVISTPKRPK